MYNHKGLRQVQNSFVPDKDLHGRNAVLLQSAVLREMLDITADILSHSHEPLSHRQTVLYVRNAYSHAVYECT